MTLPAITDGLRFLSAYLPFLPLRLSCLTHYLVAALSRLRHDSTGTPVVKILSKLPSRRLKSVGEQADSGSTISLIFLSVSVYFPPFFSLINPYNTAFWSDVPKQLHRECCGVAAHVSPHRLHVQPRWCSGITRYSGSDGGTVSWCHAQRL